jgi:hypothetical protein
MDARDLIRAVIELDILAALTDVGRVDLEVHPHDQRLTGCQLVVGEHHSLLLVSSVGLGSAEFSLIDSQQPWEKISCGNEIAWWATTSTRTWKISPVRKRSGAVDPQIGGRGMRAAGRQALPEHVEQGQQRERRNQTQQRPTVLRVSSPPA